MKRLIECVPNFSEGRDPSKVDALVAAMSGVEGVWVLDRESDTDHNRSVITLAGEPEAVAEAALRGVGKAAELIDLTRHTGAHPRVGATDVVPFIPIEGVTIEDCVVLAKKVGREIWERYRIPVYFYEAAALRPERTNLENIRRRQFEGLRQEVLANRLAAALSGVPLESKGKLAALAQPFLDAVAEPTATPGGGSVAALAGALAASLGQMVAGLSRKKKSQAAYVEQLSAAVAELRAAAEALAEAIDRDAASYEAVMAAAKLPKETKEDERLREEAMQRATRGAAEVPLYVAETAVELYERLGQLEPISAASMLSDLRVGRLMAAAAARGALENVTIKLQSISDAAYVAAMQKRATALAALLAWSPAPAGNS